MDIYFKKNTEQFIKMNFFYLSTDLRRINKNVQILSSFMLFFTAPAKYLFDKGCLFDSGIELKISLFKKVFLIYKIIIDLPG